MIVCLLYDDRFSETSRCMFAHGEGYSQCNNWDRHKNDCPTLGKQIRNNKKHHYVIDKRQYTHAEVIEVINVYKRNYQHP